MILTNMAGELKSLLIAFKKASILAIKCYLLMNDF